MNAKLRRVLKARVEIKKAKQRLSEALLAAYPFHTVTRHCRGLHWTPCMILDHAPDGNVKIRSLVTEKEYWIDSFWLEGGSAYVLERARELAP